MRPGVDLAPDPLLALRHLAKRMRDQRAIPRSTMPGDIIFRRRGRGLEVHDVRPWAEGDDIRHLDQNATARTGQPHTKTYLEERERSLLLVADFRPSMLFGTRRAFRSVAGAEALAMLGWRAVAHGGRVGLLAVERERTRFVRQGRGERAMVAVVGAMVETHRAALADVEREEPPLAEALQTAVTLASSGSSLVVATGLDSVDADLLEAAQRAGRRHDLTFLLVEDAFERDPPAGDYPFTNDSGGGGWLRIGRAKPVEENRLAALRRAGASAIRLDSSLSVERSISALELVDG